MITLYQFQFSHYCEKARWALDYKGLAYAPKNLLPGLHTRVTRKLAPKTCLPIIVDGENVVQDSTQIISYLDERYPQRALTPENSGEAKAALEWEEYVDEEIGAPLRLWFYYHTLPDRQRALRFILDGAPWYGRPLFTVIFPKVRSRMIKFMDIHAESAERSEKRVLSALERLEGVLAERRFLVGERFSRADLAACSLLAPFCAPGKTDAEISAAFPECIRRRRDAHKTDRFFRWVNDNYASYRRPVTATA